MAEVEKHREDFIAGLLFITIAVCLIWPVVRHPTWWLWKPGSPASDLAVTHWPNAHFTRRTLWEEGRFPLWRPTLMSGTPFAANPLAALFYPPNWPLLFLPWLSLALGFNLSALLHLTLAGATMYALLRRGLGAEVFGGLVGAVAYQATPKLAAQLGAGHVGWVQAWAWLPLVVLCMLKITQSGCGRAARWAVAGGLTLAVQFCADVRLSAYTLMIATSLVATRLAGPLKSRRWKDPDDPGAESRTSALTTIGLAALSLVVFVGVSACQWLPGLALLPEITRSTMTLSDAAVWSLPWRYLGGLLLADHGGFHEWVTYTGISTLALAWVGATALWRNRRRWLTVWVVGLAVFAAWFSLGTHGGLFQTLWRVVPGLGLLRVPSRAWVVVVFSAAVLAGLGLDEMQRRWDQSSRPSKGWRRVLCLGAATFPPMLVGAYWLTMSRPPLNLVMFGVVTPLTIAFCSRPATADSTRGRGGRSAEPRLRGASPGKPTTRRTWWIGVAVLFLVAVDLLVVDATFIEARSPERVFSDGKAVATWLANQPGRFRTYSPSYSIPQHVAERQGLELAYGVDPLQLRVYADYLTRAAGLEARDQYSVSLPPFPEGSEVETALAEVAPDAQLLGRLGVKYVAAAFPIAENRSTNGFEFVARFDDVLVYRNEAVSDLPAKDAKRAVILADGQALYAYREWPVVAGATISGITAILAATWAIASSRKPPYV